MFQDFILETEYLKDKRPAHSLTYCALFVLQRIEFFDILSEFDHEGKLVRMASIKLAFRRAVLATACSRRSSAHARVKFSSLTNYLAENIADPGAHQYEVHRPPEIHLLDSHNHRPDKVLNDLIQRSEARLDLHLKTMQEELALQLKASSQKTHDFVLAETVRPVPCADVRAWAKVPHGDVMMPFLLYVRKCRVYWQQKWMPSWVNSGSNVGRGVY